MPGARLPELPASLRGEEVALLFWINISGFESLLLRKIDPLLLERISDCLLDAIAKAATHL
jgi:hypothetical protein